MNDKLRELLKDNFDVALNGGVTVFGGLLSDALIGQVAPGLVTTYLSYKQKRSERMIIKMINEIRDKMDTFEANFKELSPDQIEYIKESILPYILDNVIDEEQEEKIQIIVDGLNTIVEHKITDEDIIMMYFDILRKLRMLDIKLLMEINQRDTLPEGTDGIAMIYEMLGEDEVKNVKISNAIRNRVIQTLRGYSLINITQTHAELRGDEIIIEDRRISLSVLGKGFVDFFRLGKI